ncbi:MAG: glycosyltransferase family 2 protein, partial [Planctomycetota bacterium]
TGEPMKISVVIPAYNAEKHIARAIDSVLAQTRPADEIIVVDDGSTDATAEVVRSYGEKVIFIQQENAGVSVARNAGIEAASGDWIAFLDADDEWLPEKLMLQTEHLAKHPDLKWTFTNMSWDKEKRGAVKPTHPIHRLNTILADTEYFEDYLDAYTQGFFSSTITLMIHRSVFDSVGVFEPGMKRAQDTDLWFRIAYRYPKIGYLPEPLAIYHLGTPNSSVKTNDSVDYLIDLVRRQEKFSKQHNRFEAVCPCISKMLQTRIRQFEKQHRRNDAALLLKEFNAYLSRRFRREMCFRLVVPILGSAISDAIHWVKKSKRIR